jgi:hypothetical protein
VAGDAVVFEADEQGPQISIPLSALREANDSFFRDWMEG